MNIDLNKLSRELHEAAVEKGFWDVEDSINKHVAKMHSEISEAVQEDRCGRPLLYVDDIAVVSRITDPALFDGRKPEGVAAELADFVMMALDYLEYGGVTRRIARYADIVCGDLRETISKSDFAQLAVSLHAALSKASAIETDDENTLIALCFMVYAPVVWLNGHGCDIWEIIRLKMEYNRSRPKLHGRLY